MSTMYLLPQSLLIAMIMALAASLSLQMLCIGSVFFVFRYDRRLILRCLLEAAILFHQFLLLLCGAEAIYQMSEGFLVVRSFDEIRLGSIAAVLLLGLAFCLQEKDPQALGPAVLALMTLPRLEQITGAAFPIVLVICVCFWLLRELNLLVQCRKRQLCQLSFLSVKEAIDTMHFGILLFRTEKQANGQVLLLNAQMQALMTFLTDGIAYDGAKFLEQLSSGTVSASCKKEELGELPVYTLPDGSVWRFEWQALQIRHKHCILLLASNMTEQEQINDQLYLQNRELALKNRELQAMLQNLSDICRTEETIRAKSQVHNLLGQQISLLLRSVREQKEPDESLLRIFAENLPRQMKEAASSSSFSLKSLVQNFQSIGISVSVDGEPPSDPELQKIFYDIIMEGATNAVHHGYATEISICFRELPDTWILKLSDNGTPQDGPVQEGGGLTGMRQKAEALGGSFQYEVLPHFSILIQIPRGD